MSPNTQRLATTYQNAGVDTDRGSIGLSRIVNRILQTWPEGDGIGSVKLPIGYFANVINMGDGIGMAISADGIGTKAIIAQMMGKYDSKSRSYEPSTELTSICPHESVCEDTSGYRLYCPPDLS